MRKLMKSQPSPGISPFMVILMWLCCASFIHAQTNLNIQLLGRWAGFRSGNPRAVQVAENYAYIAQGEAGLAIYDLANSTDIFAIGGFDTSGEAKALQKVGNLIYVADGLSGLQIFHVESPQALTLLGGYDTAADALAVQVVGNLAFLATYPDGLDILDVSDPAHVTRVGGFAITNYRANVKVAGNLAFVQANGLHILDVSVPTNTIRLCTYTNFLGSISHVFGDHAFMVGKSGIQILDISNPTNVVLLGTGQTAETASACFLAENLAYVVHGNGLQIFDVARPTNIVSLGAYPIWYASDVYVTSNRAYVAAGRDGLRVLDVSDPKRIYSLGTSYPSAETQCVKVSGNLAYAAVKNAGLRILNIADPAHVFGVGSYYGSFGWASSLEKVNNVVYFSYGMGWEVLDVANPLSPSQIAENSVSSKMIEVIGNRAYVAGSDGLNIFDVSVSNNIVRLGGYAGSMNTRFVHVVENRAYLIDGSKIHVLDISNPTNVVRLGGYTVYMREISTVQVVGRHAYVGTSTSFDVFDVSDPTRIVLLNSYAGGVSDLKINDNLAYIAAGASGLKVLDISEPRNIRTLGTFDTAGTAVQLDIVADRCYISDGALGLVILRLGSDKPSITIHPRNISGPSGGNLSLSVTANGSSPINYQWYFRPFGAILGATNSAFDLTNVQANQAGDYYVVVSNEFGIVTSDAAKVRVVPPVTGNLVSTWPGFTRGPALSVATVGNYAYVALNEGGIGVYDVGAMTNIVRVGGGEAAPATEVNIFGNIAYVAKGAKGVDIYDISLPAQPVWLSNHPAPVYARRTAATESLLLIAGNELEIVDITQPLSPKRISAYTPKSSVRCINIVDNLAYLGLSGTLLESHGVDIVDISDPKNPLSVGHWALPIGTSGRAVYDIQIEGSRAYILHDENGHTISVLSISDPIKPTVLGWWSSRLAPAPQRMCVRDETIFLPTGYGNGGIYALSVTNPMNISVMGYCQVPGGVKDVTVSDNIAYVAAEDGGLCVLDVSNLGRVRLLSQHLTSGVAYQLALDGGRCYVADGPGGLMALETSNVSNLTVSGYYPSNVSKVSVDGNTAYIVTGGFYDRGDLRELDVSIGKPITLRPRSWGINITAMSWLGKLGFVAGMEFGIVDSDFSIDDGFGNPKFATLTDYMTDYWNLSHCVSIRVRGSLLYALDKYDGLYVFDLSHFPNVREISSYKTIGLAKAFELVADRAYVANGANGLVILDVSDPLNIRSVGMYSSSGSVEAVQLLGNIAVLADGPAGVTVLDLSEPSDPVKVGTVAMQGCAYDVQLLGNFAYVAAGDLGVVVLRMEGLKDEEHRSPTFISQPASTTAYVGEAITLSAHVEGSPPVSYQWFKDGVPVQDDFHDHYIYGNCRLCTHSPLLHIRPLDPTDEGTYSLVASNVYGHVVSSNIALVVQGRPRIIRQPQAERIAVGSSVRLSVICDGADPLSFQWYLNDSIPLYGATRADLQLTNVQFSDSGNYRVVVTNRFGSAASSNATLEVLSPVNIVAKGGWPGISRSYVKSMNIVGQYAYLVTDSGLAIWDISDPYAPAPIGSYDVSGYTGYHRYPIRVEISGHLAYLSGWVAETGFPTYYFFDILDINDPTNIVRLGGCDCGLIVHADGDKAYVTQSGGGTEVMDVTNPTNMVTVSVVTNVTGRLISVSNGRAYASSLEGNLDIFDISNPTNWVFLGSFLTGGIGDIVVDGNIVYMVEGLTTFSVLDVSNPRNVLRIGTYASDTPIGLLKVDDGKAYLHVRSGIGSLPRIEGVLILDISEPARPLARALYNTDCDNIFCVGTVTNLAYVSSDCAGLQILNIEGLTNVHSVGSSVIGGNAKEVRVAGRFAYVADGNSGLQIFDVSDPSRPSRVSGYDVGGFAFDVQIVGQLAYVLYSTPTNGGFQVLNISNPYSAVLISKRDVGRLSSGSINVADGIAYVKTAIGGQGLLVFDVRNPAIPVLLSTYDVAPSDFWLDGTRGYVAAGDRGLLIFDVSNPTNFIALGVYQIPTGSISKVWAFGSRAYLSVYADGGLSTRIVDVSDPANVRMLGKMPLADDLQAIGNLVVSVYYFKGLSIFDVSDPTLPAIVGQYSSAQPKGLTVVGNRAFLADSSIGLLILEIPELSQPLPYLTGVQYGNGSLRFSATGLVWPVTVILESSEDLGAWTGIQTNITVGANINFVVPYKAINSGEFFRAKVVP